jgi:hypothetical protein
VVVERRRRLDDRCRRVARRAQEANRYPLDRGARLLGDVAGVTGTEPDDED